MGSSRPTSVRRPASGRAGASSCAPSSAATASRSRSPTTDAASPPSCCSEAGQNGSLVDLLARPGFSTADHVDGVAGRGVGLDAVKAHVESLGGSVEVQSEAGRGTAITLLLPLTLAVLHVLLVERLGQVLGLPLARVEEVVTVEDTTALSGQRSIVLRGESIPLGDLAAALGGGGELSPRPPALVVTHAGRTRRARVRPARSGRRA